MLVFIIPVCKPLLARHTPYPSPGWGWGALFPSTSTSGPLQGPQSSLPPRSPYQPTRRGRASNIRAPASPLAPEPLAVSSLGAQERAALLGSILADCFLHYYSQQPAKTLPKKHSQLALPTTRVRACSTAPADLRIGGECGEEGRDPGERGDRRQIPAGLDCDSLTRGGRVRKDHLPGREKVRKGQWSSIRTALRTYGERENTATPAVPPSWAPLRERSSQNPTGKAEAGD